MNVQNYSNQGQYNFSKNCSKKRWASQSVMVHIKLPDFVQKVVLGGRREPNMLILALRYL